MPKFLFLRKNNTYVNLPHKDILYIETIHRCAKIVTAHKTFLVVASLCRIAKKLPADLFCRIHQSYIVSLRHLDQFNCDTACVAGQQLPIGRKYKALLMKKIEVFNCDSRGKSNSFEDDMNDLLGDVTPN